MNWIDFRSDTVTQPTQAMREAIAAAEVGDDVYGDDPTVNKLQEDAAAILGKEAALFVSSGTMGNQLGIMSQTKRGDEVIVSRDSHIFCHEVGAASVLSGVLLNTVPMPSGMPCAQIIEDAIRPDDIHEPPTSLICIENALGCGRVIPATTMAEIYAVAQKHHLPIHLDGARIFNAAVSQGVGVTELTRYCDTISCCLSKGLCAPVGAIFAGPRAVVERAKKFRKMLGGGLRQSGFLAAAGLCALHDMPARLADDHANARALAARLHAMQGIDVAPENVQINLVFCTIHKSEAWQAALPARLLEKGIKINGADRGEFRFVTNHGVSADNVQYLADCLEEFMAME